MKEKEFTIDSLPNNQFRVAKISPVELLALSTTQTDFNNFTQSLTLFTYALEHTEVLMGENQWVKVKTPGREVYFPMKLEENFQAMQEIVMYFITEVIGKTFQKSSE